MALQTNLDRKLTPEQMRKAELSERRKAFIDERYSKSERDYLEGTQPADIVFGFQRQGAFSSDPIVDKDHKRVRRLGKLPVKQHIVAPDGTWCTYLGEPGEAAYEAAKEGLFCVTCTNRQPDTAEQWETRMQRLEERIGPRAAGVAFNENCCYCGGKLGFAGDGDNKISNISEATREQKILLEMFGGVKGLV